jgi:hypothetical protein
LYDTSTGSNDEGSVRWEASGEERFVHFHLLRDRRVSAVGEDEQAISARLAR